ncbi:MAG: hypothetical protein VB036_04690, partial [Propionicimonas sp.]|nr:hypothetical protein [Propionicimonas sp.]
PMAAVGLALGDPAVRRCRVGGGPDGPSVPPEARMRHEQSTTSTTAGSPLIGFQAGSALRGRCRSYFFGLPKSAVV